jgi:hypothetical protein
MCEEIPLADQDVLISVPHISVFAVGGGVDWRITPRFAHPVAIALRKKS